MLRKISVIALLFCLTTTVNAQEDSIQKKSKFKFTGAIDGYFRSDFKSNVANNRTSFTNTTGKLALGMVEAKLDYEDDKFGFTADFAAGKRQREFAYNDKGVLSYIKQLYAYYSPTDWLKLTAGTWGTHVGYELMEPYVNKNYSMSYMFSYGPFLQTGVKADFSFGKSSDFMIGISNATDYRDPPNPNKKSFLMQYSQYITDDVSILLNYIGNQRPTDLAKIRQFEVLFIYNISDKFSADLNATVNTTRLKTESGYGKARAWSGIATYLNYTPSTKFDLTLRTEVFNDKYQLSALSTATKGGAILANTLTANFSFGNLSIIPELRWESATNNVFYAKDGTPKGSSGSFLIGAFYKFSK
jgi:hypothetical protein